MNKVKGIVTNVFTDLTTHWGRPAKGNYVSYKEIFSLGTGGMGQHAVTTLVGCLALGAGNTLLGATIGIRPMHLQYMATIQTILNLIFYVVRAKMVDNTRTKYGRFRPYIAIMGFPLVLLTTIFIFLPFDIMGYSQRLIATFCFAIVTSMISPLFTDTYSEMQTVITPNSEERAKVISINALILGFAPTVTGLFIPILSNLTGGYTNILTYRAILVPVALIGVSLNLFTAFGCKERVITSKSYVQKVGVIQGCLMIYRNKHWWLRTIAGIIGFLEGASGILFSWIYIYGTQDMVSYGVLSTVMGSAAGIAMAITPFLLKKVGNKRLLIGHNAFNILFLGVLIFTYKVPLIMFILFYCNALVNALANVYNQVMHSEVKDYQQYLCGKRMDFMFGMAGLIVMPITLLTGYAIPYVYEFMGLTTNYDILYDPTVRNSLFLILCILSVIGAIINLIPFCFYSLSKEKHKNYIRVLRYRAMFEDYEANDFSPETIKNGVEDLRSGFAIFNAEMPSIATLKARVKELKAAGEPSALAKAKQALRDAEQLVKDKEVIYIFMDEVNKFDTPEYVRRVAQAKRIISHDVNAIIKTDKAILDKIKTMPRSTKDEKIAYRFEKQQAKALLKTAALLKKNYSDKKLVKPDIALLERAQAMPDVTKEEHKLRNVAIKKIEKQLDLYYKIVAPYVAAEKLVLNAETCKVVVAECESRYEEACLEIDRLEVEKEQVLAQKKADKKEETANRKGKK